MNMVYSILFCCSISGSNINNWNASQCQNWFALSNYKNLAFSFNLCCVSCSLLCFAEEFEKECSRVPVFVEEVTSILRVLNITNSLFSSSSGML